MKHINYFIALYKKQILNEISTSMDSGGNDADDGPQFIYSTADAYRMLSPKKMQELGWQVLSYMLPKDFEVEIFNTSYPKGPMHVNTTYPVRDYTLPSDFKSHPGYGLWKWHIHRLADKLGMMWVDKMFIEDVDYNELKESVGINSFYLHHENGEVFGGAIKNKLNPIGYLLTESTKWNDELIRLNAICNLIPEKVNTIKFNNMKIVTEDIELRKIFSDRIIETKLNNSIKNSVQLSESMKLDINDWCGLFDNKLEVFTLQNNSIVLKSNNIYYKVPKWLETKIKTI